MKIPKRIKKTYAVVAARISPELKKSIDIKARREGHSLQAIVETALTQYARVSK